MLEVYKGRMIRDRPLVCLDETSKQMIRETRTPVPMTGPPATHRLRIRAQRHRQHLHVVRSPGRLAARRGDRSACRSRLRAIPEGFFRRVFSRCGEDRARAGQSLHAPAGVALCHIPGRRSATSRPAVRVALHTKARKLAGHGRIRTRACSQLNVSTAAFRTSRR